MKQYTVILTEPQAHALGFVLLEAIRLQDAKLACGPDNEWRKKLCRELHDAKLQLEISPANELPPSHQAQPGSKSGERLVLCPRPAGA
jgi:hypothetical protein